MDGICISPSVNKITRDVTSVGGVLFLFLFFFLKKKNLLNFPLSSLDRVGEYEIWKIYGIHLLCNLTGVWTIVDLQVLL